MPFDAAQGFDFFASTEASTSLSTTQHGLVRDAGNDHDAEDDLRQDAMFELHRVLVDMGHQLDVAVRHGERHAGGEVLEDMPFWWDRWRRSDRTSPGIDRSGRPVACAALVPSKT